MDDRTYCTLHLYGPVPRSVLKAAADSVYVLGPFTSNIDLDEIEADGFIACHDCTVDQFDIAKALLKERGLLYRFEQGGHTGSYTARVTLCTPADGEHEFAFDGEHLCVQVEGKGTVPDQAAIAARMLDTLAETGALKVIDDRTDEEDGLTQVRTRAEGIRVIADRLEDVSETIDQATRKYLALFLRAAVVGRRRDPNA